MLTREGSLLSPQIVPYSADDFYDLQPGLESRMRISTNAAESLLSNIRQCKDEANELRAALDEVKFIQRNSLSHLPPDAEDDLDHTVDLLGSEMGALSARLHKRVDKMVSTFQQLQWILEQLQLKCDKAASELDKIICSEQNTFASLCEQSIQDHASGTTQSSQSSGNKQNSVEDNDEPPEENSNIRELRSLLHAHPHAQWNRERVESD